MAWLNFQSYTIWLNLGIFAVAAALIWIAGSRISGYAERTGVDKAFFLARLPGAIPQSI
jgi:cation:H+ antiporter